MAGLSSKDEAQARSNYFDLKRDETMALSEYLESPVAVKDLKSNPAPKGRKRGGTDVDEDEKPGLLRRLIDQKANRKKYLKSDEGKAEAKARRLHNERMGPKDKDARRKLRADAKKADAEKGSKMLNKGGTKMAKKHIMDLPTNVPRLQKGASMIADINKNGKIEGWEQARSDAIQKNMKKSASRRS